MCVGEVSVKPEEIEKSVREKTGRRESKREKIIHCVNRKGRK